MSDPILDRQPVPPSAEQKLDEGGLRPPPGLGFWGKAWWWFHFLILVKLARLRFIAILVLIGVVIVKWDTLVAYYDRWTRPASAGQTASSDHEWFCPMHPTVVRDNPKDKCPICFMPLSKRKKGEDKQEPLPPGIVNRVQLSPYRVVLAGINTWEAKYLRLEKELTTVGFIEFNEREVKHVAARVKGRLDKLLVSETGQMVHADTELASLYSPDLVATVQNLLDADRSKNAELARIARERLELWGIKDDQVQEILRTKKPITHLTIRSPIEGHVTKKFIKEGQYVEEGSPLYELVDLKTVWVQAQVYEEDMPFLPPHRHGVTGKEEVEPSLSVTATTPASPGRSFTGKLSFIFPHVDPDTRTVTVRFELDNSDLSLRPGTTATVKLRVPPRRVGVLTEHAAWDWVRANVADGATQAFLSWSQPERLMGLVPLLHAAGREVALREGFVLAVPEGAVIDTGSMKLVYREIGPAEYEGVKVELGPRMLAREVEGDVFFYPVLLGIQEGDKIVAAGSFLLDAETRLNPAAGSIYFGGSSGSGATSSSTVRPTTPTDPEETVTAALAKLSGEDRKMAAAQKFCPVLKDSRLGLMGTPVKLMLEGQPVFLCCESCRAAALATPKKTLAKVKDLKVRSP